MAEFRVSLGDDDIRIEFTGGIRLVLSRGHPNGRLIHSSIEMPDGGGWNRIVLQETPMDVGQLALMATGLNVFTSKVGSEAADALE